MDRSLKACSISELLTNSRDQLALASVLQDADELSKASLLTSIRTLAQSGDPRTGQIEATGGSALPLVGASLGRGGGARGTEKHLAWPADVNVVDSWVATGAGSL